MPSPRCPPRTSIWRFAEKDTRILTGRSRSATRRRSASRPGSRVVEWRLSGALRSRHRDTLPEAQGLDGGPSHQSPSSNPRGDGQAESQGPRPGRNHSWRKHFRTNVAQSVARQERLIVVPYGACYSFGSGSASLASLSGRGLPTRSDTK